MTCLHCSCRPSLAGKMSPYAYWAPLCVVGNVETKCRIGLAVHCINAEVVFFRSTSYWSLDAGHLQIYPTPHVADTTNFSLVFCTQEDIQLFDAMHCTIQKFYGMCSVPTLVLEKPSSLNVQMLSARRSRRRLPNRYSALPNCQ